MSPSRKSQTGFECPHCGSFVRSGARVCRECGASDEYGWGDVDLLEPDYGDDDFDYDEFTAREFPDQASSDSPSIKKKTFIALIVLALLAALIVSSF